MTSSENRSKLHTMQNLALLVILLGGFAFFSAFVNQHYPIEEWLFFRYATYWAYSLFFALSALSVGLFTLRVARVGLPFVERLVVAFAVGVFEFELLMFVFGVFQAYNTVTFFVAPLLLLTSGAPEMLRLFRRAFRLSASVERRPEFWRSPKRRAVSLLAVALGCAGLFML